MNNKYDVIVIGGGPSGMMAAGRAGALGANVLIIEKNNRLGKKLSITGGRRCNITNAEFDNRIFLDSFPESKQFLFSPFSKFNVEDTFAFFEGRGLPIMVEDRKRAFPRSEKAEDVCSVLVDYVNETGNADVKLSTEFKSFIEKDGHVTGVETSLGSYYASRFILATGGLAAPETGSTGDGLSALTSIGHTVKEPDPSLVPLRSSAKWARSLTGVSVDDVGLSFILNGRTQHKVNGRVLFTHFGISGPTVINAAYIAKKLLKKGKLTAAINLFPDYEFNELDEKVRVLLKEYPKRMLKGVLKELIQKRLAETILETMTPYFGDVKASVVSKEHRRKLVHALQDMRMPITGTMGFAWSIVADGGVMPEEIDFKNMASKLHPNIYLIGDTININRPSGGFSLQLCWTMGWIAGSHAASK